MQKKAGIEESLNKLEAIVSEMQDGELPLEQALGKFEKGIKLAGDCQKALQEVEQKVAVLIKENGSLREQPFSPDNDE